ncbi:MAG: endoglucanase [Phycisphaerales bacterium]|nr:endoglucanase [Phycisphaerales bacterium]
MNRRDFLSTAAAGFSTAGLYAMPAAISLSAHSLPRLRGVTLAGAEFGVKPGEFTNESPGEHGRAYLYNSERTVAYFAGHGFSLFRIPFRWERIQPRLGEALDAVELGRLREMVGHVKAHGGQAILDVHNFARYAVQRDEEAVEIIIDQEPGGFAVTRKNFADLWRRLSDVFRGESAIYGYGLMNEPHHMGTSDWKLISQAAVEALRANNDKTLLLIPGLDWSSAERFADANGTRAWINDPADHIAYEAHCYFDHDSSGTYKQSYDKELEQDKALEHRGVRRLIQFAGWCAVNGVRGFVGEYGVPNDDPRWLLCLRHFLDALDKIGMPGCYWAAGEWWGDADRLSIQPRRNWAEPAAQLKVLVG